jgi:hypothetical protein
MQSVRKYGKHDWHSTRKQIYLTFDMPAVVESPINLDYFRVHWLGKTLR